MAIRDVTGHTYREARATYDKWRAKQRNPKKVKSFKDWLRTNCKIKVKKFTNTTKEVLA